MTAESSTPPAPEARAPRAPACPTVLLPAPPALQGALVAVIVRDTHGVPLTAEQRLSHFPASPLLSLHWYSGACGGLLHSGDDWQPLPADACVSGSQARPVTSWFPGPVRAGMVCFTADIARSLLGLDPAAVQDRCVEATAVLPEDLHPLLDDLRAATDAAAVLAALTRHLGPRWQALCPGVPILTPLRRAGRHWVETLALSARQWRGTHSERQVERRIRAFSGRSLRDWQALVRTESAFHAARDHADRGTPLPLAALAAEEGFADQAHFSREVRRITGFPPGEFTRRFLHDESFWLYRLWV